MSLWLWGSGQGGILVLFGTFNQRQADRNYRRLKVELRQRVLNRPVIFASTRLVCYVGCPTSSREPRNTKEKTRRVPKGWDIA